MYVQYFRSKVHPCFEMPDKQLFALDVIEFPTQSQALTLLLDVNKRLNCEKNALHSSGVDKIHCLT